MDQQPEAVVETPKRKIRIPLPSRKTLTRATALTGAFALGAVVAKRKLEKDCACETDAGEQPSTTDN